MFRLLVFRFHRPTQVSVTVAFLLLLVVSGQAPALDAKRPSLKLKGVSIKSLDLSSRTAKTDLVISIDNPGPAFKLKDLSYRLKLNEKQAAEGKYEKTIEMPAESSTIVELPCTVDLSSLPGVAWSVISGGFEVQYKLETEFTVPLFGSLNPRLKNSIAGELSLAQTISGWTARIIEHIESK